MLDSYMETYAFREQHQVEVAGTAKEIYTCARSIDYRESKLVNFLFSLRGMPKTMSSVDGLIENGLVLLEEDPGREFAIGFITDLRSVKTVAAEAFHDFNVPGYIKGITNYRVSRQGTGRLILSTETRLKATSVKAKIVCALYWACIRPLSGLIRLRILNLMKVKLEQPSAA